MTLHSLLDSGCNVGRVVVRLRGGIEIEREFNLLTRDTGRTKDKFVAVPTEPGNDSGGAALSGSFVKINPDITDRLVIVGACIVALASPLIQQSLFEQIAGQV